MKVKVLTKFKDKHTDKIHKPGEILEISEGRYKEILSKGKLIEIVKEDEISSGSKEKESEEVAPAQKKNTKKKNVE